MPSLNDIRLAMLAKLATLLGAGGPALVGDVRGEPSVGQAPAAGAFEDELGARASGVLLALEGEAVVDGSAVVTMHRRVAQTALRSTWRVYVCVAETRSAAIEAGGAVSTPGMLPLCESVRVALDGLVIPDPVATLAVRVTGTPSAAVAFGSAKLAAGGVSYAPTTTGVTLNGAGEATIAVRPVTPGAIGNQLLGVTLTWSVTPSGLASTATVTARTVEGRNGLLRGERVRFVDARHYGSRPGQLAVRVLRFSVLRAGCLAENALPVEAALSLVADVNLLGTADDPENPVTQIETTPEP